MSRSLLLLLPAFALHLVYFNQFLKLIRTLSADENARFIKAGSPLISAMGIAPIALLFFPPLWVRLTGAVLLVVLLPLATSLHHRRLAAAGFSKAFRSRLLSMTALSAAGIFLAVLALAFR